VLPKTSSPGTDGNPKPITRLFCALHPRVRPVRRKHWKCPACLSETGKRLTRARELARMSQRQRAFEFEVWEAYASRVGHETPPAPRLLSELEIEYRHAVTRKPARPKRK
jgi:hypothetical protein